MLRAVDLELLAVAAAAGLTIAAGAVRARRGSAVGVVVVVGAVGLAWVGDRRFVHALPDDLVSGGRAWIAVAVAAGAAGGALRLAAARVGAVPIVLPLALGSLIGVWAGVPETSAALLAGGAVGGVGVVVVVARRGLSRWAAMAISVAPAAAALVGAAGQPHALVGGLLCSATFVVLAVGRPIGPVSVPAAVRSVAAHLVLAGVAARQIAVDREGPLSWAWIAVAAALALAAARFLRAQRTDA